MSGWQQLGLMHWQYQKGDFHSPDLVMCAQLRINNRIFAIDTKHNQQYI